MRIKGGASHHDDFPFLGTLQLGTFLGSIKGGSFQNFPIETDFGINEEVWCGILEDVDGIERIELDVRLAIGDVIAQAMSAIDEPSGLVFDSEVKVGSFGKSMG